MLKILLLLAALTGGFFVSAQVETPLCGDAANEVPCEVAEKVQESTSLLPWPIDLELGNTYVLGGTQYPYLLTRASIALGPEVLGSQVFLLPEVGVFFRGETSFWLRTQLLFDGPTNTLFLDAQTSPLLGTQARVGIRFGF